MLEAAPLDVPVEVAVAALLLEPMLVQEAITVAVARGHGLAEGLWEMVPGLLPEPSKLGEVLGDGDPWLLRLGVTEDSPVLDIWALPVPWPVAVFSTL